MLVHTPIVILFLFLALKLKLSPSHSVSPSVSPSVSHSVCSNSNSCSISSPFHCVPRPGSPLNVFSCHFVWVQLKKLLLVAFFTNPTLFHFKKQPLPSLVRIFFFSNSPINTQPSTSFVAYPSKLTLQLKLQITLCHYHSALTS
jgi:hypothetical protein